ncbi:cbxX protein [Cladorrhinum sp. PSN332]|nr:cbxX protein [Cladorrhinum sp. PSN332]
MLTQLPVGVSAEASPFTSRPTTPISIASTTPSSVPPSPGLRGVGDSLEKTESSEEVQLPSHASTAIPQIVLTEDQPSMIGLPSDHLNPALDQGTPDDQPPLSEAAVTSDTTRSTSRVVTPSTSRSSSPSPSPSRSPSPAPLDSSSELSDEVAPLVEPPVCVNPFGPIKSDAAREWERRKREHKEENDVMDELMGYVGLEDVKKQFLDIKSKVDICKEQGRKLNKERFNVVFQGNPGTGKTTIARLYARFLYSMGLVGSSEFKEKSGIKLCSKGATGVKRMFKKLFRRHEGGVLFVDEAYQLTAAYTDGMGRQALDIILTTMENEIGRLAVIFVGYKDDMESFYEHNQGLSSRIPYTMNFADFTDVELWQILHDNIVNQYQGKMEVEGGMDGLYMRVTVRRLARSRKNRGFGNARAVENLLAQITGRQARRLTEEKREGGHPDPLFLTKEDLVGPEPDLAVQKSRAYVDLQKLIGLESVKQSVQSVVRMTQLNYRRELAELKPFQLSLNQVFVGAPGTGKTTVAKLYGRILADIGLLSRGDVILKTPADFIGECLGKSEAKTRKILEATVGKVLVIDEAYMLDAGDSGKEQDKFKTGVIDTLVAMVQGVPGEDRCIILVGYEDKICSMFHNVNPGLSRRFPIANPFRFNNFDLPQLMEIMDKKMDEQDLEATPEALETATDVLERALMRPNFSNAGEVDSVLATAKMNFEMRQATKPSELQCIDGKLESADFDKDFAKKATDRNAGINISRELEGHVHNTIIKKLESYQATCIGARKAGLKPRDQVPTNFVFKGFTGTGKTTTAKHMGQVFYNMGFLATPEVIECSATDLIGHYVGHTCPKTRKALEKALGKVLFIDEAWRLRFGEFAAQAVDEIVQFLSQPAHGGRMLVILAGYSADMNLLMTQYPALSTLFTEEIYFENLSPEECILLLLREFSRSKVSTENNFLMSPLNRDYITAARLFKALQVIPGWGNARDVKHLAKRILAKFLEDPMVSRPESQPARCVTVNQVHSSLFELVNQRRERFLLKSPNFNANLPTQPPIGSDSTPTLFPPPQLATPVDTNVATSTGGATNTAVDTAVETRGEARTQVQSKTRHTNEEGDDEQTSPTPQQPAAVREDGVSDEQWAELEAERKAQAQNEKRGRQLQRDLTAAEAAVANDTAGGGDNCSGLNGRCDALRNELTDHAKILAKQKETRRQLQAMGRCVNGYLWYQVGGGWRCGGGAHFVHDDELIGRVGV